MFLNAPVSTSKLGPAGNKPRYAPECVPKAAPANPAKLKGSKCVSSDELAVPTPDSEFNLALFARGSGSGSGFPCGHM